MTEADLAVEREVKRVLAERRPDDAYLGEETGISGAGTRRWVLDGIDGTVVFVRGEHRWPPAWAWRPRPADGQRRTHKLKDVAHALAEQRAVRYLGATVDGRSLLCEVIASSTKALFEFTTSTVATLDGVIGWNASVELLTLNRGFVETPWWRAQLAGRQANRTAVG